MNLLPFPLALVLPTLVISHPDHNQTAKVEINRFSKEYDIKNQAPEANLEIPYINDFFDNSQLIKQSANKLAHQIVAQGWHMQMDTIVVPGDKANSVGLVLADILRHLKPSIEFVVLRESEFADPVHRVAYQAHIEPEPKEMHIRRDQIDKIQGKNIVIINDVISTGTVVKATKDLVEKAGGHVLGLACVATEGLQDPGDVSDFEGLTLLRATHIPANKLN